MIIGLLSTYLEGRLAAGAVASLRPAVDHLVIFEGPAGPPLEAADRIPPSQLGDHRPDMDVKHGAWSTDAQKRTAIVNHVHKHHPTARWAVWLDGDELLVNAGYLPDYLAYFDAVEEQTGRENMGWPIKLVEMDGTIAIVQAKVLRIDRLRNYSVSSSVFRNSLGNLEARGNYPPKVDDFPIGAQLRQLGDPNGGKLFAWPPVPGEPFIVHRSGLRHPLRSGLRLHEQEAVELDRFKRERGE